jgi:transposase InsO family protein
MSKRQSVILSVVLEGRSQADTAKLYGISEATVSRWVTRYRTDGDTAFQPRSRRPNTTPTRLAEVLITQIVNLRDELTTQGLDAGPATIAWHLEHHHHTTVSIATIRRHLIHAGRITPEPRKRPRSSFIRFVAELPNDTWQTDMTHVHLARNGHAEVLTWLDDHSRYALSVTAHHRVTTPIVVTTFDETTQQHGLPASVLSDNGLYYTARFARGGNSGPNRFEQHLIAHGITQKHSRPNHPTTCGKVERFQQTLKKWLTHQPAATNLDDLQTLLDTFVHTYNHHRPHRSLGTTPATAYTRLPKTGPNGTPPDLRIRHDRVDTTGSVTLRYNSRLHHIGIGRPHTGTPVTLLIIDRDIRIINTNTGQLLRHLTLDPTRNYQPQNARNPNP